MKSLISFSYWHFNKDSTNINEKYAIVANDYAYQKIHSAEEVILRIRGQKESGSSNDPAKSNGKLEQSRL